MVPELGFYESYEQTHLIAQHRSLTHEQVWQLRYNDAMLSVGFMYQTYRMQKHLERLQNPNQLPTGSQ